MPCPHLERLREILWPAPTPGDHPSGDAYALLDAARDVRIYQTLRRSLVDSCCLFAGNLPQALAEAAPYLVVLARDSELSARLIDLAWDNSAILFVTSTAMLQDLRRHFRRFLKVHDESGEGLFFRFYDPRVFRVYLPTCNAEELKILFGPVDRYLVEAEEPDTLLEYRRSGPELVEEVVALK